MLTRQALTASVRRLDRKFGWLRGPDVNQRLFCKERNALASALIALKRCVFGPNGPTIKAKAVHEIVVSSSQGWRLRVRNGQVSLHEHLPKEQVIIRTRPLIKKSSTPAAARLASQRACFASTPSSHLSR